MQDECQEILEQVELYLDGELAASVHAEIHAHLEACSPCMHHSEFKRHLKELVRDRCGCDEVPSDLLERIRSSLDEPSA